MTGTDAWPEPVAPFESVAVADTASVPFTANVVVKLAPAPVAGLPLGADQEKVKDPLPPAADALQVTGLPADAVPHVTVTVITTGLTVTSWVTVAWTVFESVTVRTTWKVVAADTV